MNSVPETYDLLQMFKFEVEIHFAVFDLFYLLCDSESSVCVRLTRNSVVLFILSFCLVKLDKPKHVLLDDCSPLLQLFLHHFAGLLWSSHDIARCF